MKAKQPMRIIWDPWEPYSGCDKPISTRKPQRKKLIRDKIEGQYWPDNNYSYNLASTKLQAP